MNEAIKEKQKLINRLQKSITQQTETNESLSETDEKNIVEHFKKKIEFYVMQNTTKWKEWPNKRKKNKEANYKRRKKRRKKRTEDDAKKALESGSVVILVDKEVPPGAIALLGKGLNFIPTPTINPMEEQLDMRLNTNRILHAASSGASDGNILQSVPSKLSHKRYAAAKPAEENTLNNIVNNIAEEHNGRLQFQNDLPKKKNITKDEEEGLRWLVKETKEKNIAVVKADKGGAILIVKPQLLEKAVLDKLEDPNLYERLETDPTNALHDELFTLWVKGKKAEYVTPAEAAKVMGVTPENNKSTSSRFKPGTSYFYPMLKIHKLQKEQLVPGVNPPARLVTALQDGISKRSDVFIAERFLKELESNFCEDLLKDTNSALNWLEMVNQNYSTNDKKHMKAFTFDFKSLYDSISPNLVIEALRYAMTTCRPGWSERKRKWILDLIKVSLLSSIGKFKENFYLQKNGVPTGGSLCVQLANITVYYVMNKAVYSNEELMRDVKEAKRYIDDGGGFYVGSDRSFTNWIAKVNEALVPYGLLIDEYTIKEVGVYVPFLDVQFCFDINGDMQTDLYVKPTDARSYLNFTSAHPSHTFTGIVYSQCLRLRRIINNQDRLIGRLNELCSAFEKSGYPKSMLQNISTKVQNMQRQIERPMPVVDDDDSKPILVVSCYGTDDKLIKTLKAHEEDILKTNSFKDASKPLFQFVKKTSTNIGNKLSILKSIALGCKNGVTVPCYGHRNCKCCQMIDEANIDEVNGLSISTAPGNCKSKNVVYLVSCRLCSKPYFGRTVQQICKRMSGHRECYYKVLRNHDDVDVQSDDYSLGLHIVNEHGCTDESDFNRLYSVQIIENCSPSSLEKKEHCYIHRYNTLFPIGLNKTNPFGLPILSC